MAHKHIIYMMLTDSAANLKDADALGRYASELEVLAERDEHRPYLAIAHRAWGIAHRLAGNYDDSEQRLSMALEIFEELGIRWQLGRTLYEMAELDLARSDKAGARDRYSEALAAFEAMGAAPSIEQTRAALGALGEE